MSDPVPFSTALRERASSAHSTSEHAGFMADLITGDGTRDDYVSLVVQHWFIYDALEAAAERMRRDPVASVFISDKLTRLPALEADLEFLVGPDWRDRIEALPTTRRYVDRIRQVGATWPGGFVAHHYTRYLGDMSGGQHIAKLMRRHFGLEGHHGTEFYNFEAVGDLDAFKNGYRAALDSAPWDDDEKERIIQEVLYAYEVNGAVLRDLGDEMEQWRTTG